MSTTIEHASAHGGRESAGGRGESVVGWYKGIVRGGGWTRRERRVTSAHGWAQHDVGSNSGQWTTCRSRQSSGVKAGA